MNWQQFEIPPEAMAVVLTIAALVLIAANRSGHYPIFIPIAFSLMWIAMAYVFDILNLIDPDVSATMIRGGVFVIAIDLIVGGVIYIYFRWKKP